MLSVSHSRPAHADRTAIERMMAIKAVVRLDIVYLQPTRSFSICVEGTMLNPAMKLRTTLEMQPGTVLPTDVAEMSVIIFGGARYFLNFIGEASGHVSIFDMKTIGKAAEFLKRQVKWPERQTECKVRKIILDGHREYLKGCTKLDADGINISLTASYTPEEMVGRSE